jgi:hypothetical protein
MELIGPYLMGCALLVVAGLAKAVRPADTARALAGVVPIRSHRLAVLVRMGALFEVALGLVALVVPRTGPAAAVALSYAVFAAYVAVLRLRGGPLATCGCFGTPDTPATGVHVAVNAGLALSAAAVAASDPSGTLVAVLARQPLHGLPLVAASTLGAWLCYLAVSVLADLAGARRLTGVTFGPRGTGS